MTSSEPDVHSRIVALVRGFPGIHLREVARQLDVSEALAGYHLDLLVAEQRIRSEVRDGYRRFYVAGAHPETARERELLALLRQRVPLRIILILLERGTVMHADLADKLDLSKAAVSYQLGKLVDAGVVEHAEGGGFRLVDRPGIERALKRWKPTPDVIERFSDLWESFYSRKRRP